MPTSFPVPASRLTSLTASSGGNFCGTLCPAMGGGWQFDRYGEPTEYFTGETAFAAGVWRLKQLAGRDAKWQACANFEPMIYEVDLATDPNSCAAVSRGGEQCHQVNGHAGEHWWGDGKQT